jgi:hypothetical protein
MSSVTFWPESFSWPRDMTTLPVSTMVSLARSYETRSQVACLPFHCMETSPSAVSVVILRVFSS